MRLRFQWSARGAQPARAAKPRLSKTPATSRGCASALPMRLVWFACGADFGTILIEYWAAQTIGRAGSAVAKCIDTMKAGRHMR
eukprot:scaffold33523_cov112-Isochrysis_galbana.AAC.10